MAEQKLCNLGDQLVRSAGHVGFVEDTEKLLIIPEIAMISGRGTSACVTVQQK